MRSVSDLLKWAPALPDNVLNQLDKDRFRFALSLSELTAGLLERRISEFSGADLGACLNRDSVAKIGREAARDAVHEFETIPHNYLGQNPFMVTDPYRFLDRLAAELVCDARDFFREAVDSALLQWSSLSVYPDDPYTRDPGFFLHHITELVHNEVEGLRRPLEFRMLARLGEDGNGLGNGQQTLGNGRPNRGGRPRSMLEIHGEKVTALRGDAKKTDFANWTRLSDEVVQLAEQGQATDKTIKTICKYSVKIGKKMNASDLKKNQPQKPE